MRKAFASALKRIRKAKGLTQEDFALTTSRTYLSSLERGLQSPTLDKVQALAETLSIHPISLLALTFLYYDNQYDIHQLIAQMKQELLALEQEKQTSMIRVLLTDDHTIVRDSMKQLIALVDDMTVAAEAANGSEAMALLDAGGGNIGIDILLLDMHMPGICGKDLIAIIRNHHPNLPILVLSMHIEPFIAQSALDAGAQGYLSKDHEVETVLNAIRIVADGGRYIDPKLADQVRFAAD